MTKKRLKTLHAATRPEGTSDADWALMKDGYKEMQSTLYDLAKEIGADYEKDVGLSKVNEVNGANEANETSKRATGTDHDVSKLSSKQIIEKLFKTKDNKSLLDRPVFTGKDIQSFKSKEFIEEFLELSKENNNQVLLYPCDGTDFANSVIEKMQDALDNGLTVDQLNAFSKKIAFNFNNPVATSRNPNIEAFILPHGGILFQSEDRFYEIDAHPLTEIIISKDDFISEIHHLCQTQAKSKSKKTSSRIVFISHDPDTHSFVKTETPPHSLRHSDQCVTFLLNGADLTGLKKLNPNQLLEHALDQEYILLLRSFSDRVFIYKVQYARNSYYDDNLATDDTLAAIYSVAALREVDTPVKYDLFDDNFKGFVDYSLPIAKHFTQRTLWLCKQANFHGLGDKTKVKLAPELLQIIVDRTINLEYYQNNIYDSVMGNLSYTKLQLENCQRHPNLFSTDSKVPASYPMGSVFKFLLEKYSNLFVIQLSLKFFESTADLQTNFFNKISSLFSSSIELSESQITLFDSEYTTIGFLESKEASDHITNLTAQIDQEIVDSDLEDFSEAIDNLDYNLISIGFCADGLPLAPLCDILSDFSENFDTAVLYVPHLGIYQSFSYGDMDSGNISYRFQN